MAFSRKIYKILTAETAASGKNVPKLRIKALNDAGVKSQYLSKTKDIILNEEWLEGAQKGDIVATLVSALKHDAQYTKIRVYRALAKKNKESMLPPEDLDYAKKLLAAERDFSRVSGQTIWSDNFMIQDAKLAAKPPAVVGNLKDYYLKSNSIESLDYYEPSLFGMAQKFAYITELSSKIRTDK